MRVAVLMSTFQGEAFVEPQIASILGQLPPDGQLLIRDDGSTDCTLEIIRRFSDPRIAVEVGQNVGFAQSFFRLLARAGHGFDVFMLADQDDVWLPEKIARACAALSGTGDRPTLYFSRLRMVDERLALLGDSPLPPRGPSFENALCENIVTGCTLALNRSGVTLALRTGDQSAIYFHDWWIYLVVSAFGEVRMDNEATVLYRQHGKNVVGRGAGLARYLSNLSFVRKRSWVHIMYSQIGNFMLAHGADLDPQRRAVIERYFNPTDLASTTRFLLHPVRRRQFLLDEFLLRAMILHEASFGRGLLPGR